MYLALGGIWKTFAESVPVRYSSLIMVCSMTCVSSMTCVGGRMYCCRFSVAWYPIYCIPEGKLRTSFLTYHSVGPMHQVSNHMIGEFEQLQAHLIGIKFMALSPDAWNRPQTKPSDSNRYARRCFTF